MGGKLWAKLQNSKDYLSRQTGMMGKTKIHVNGSWLNTIHHLYILRIRNLDLLSSHLYTISKIYKIDLGWPLLVWYLSTDNLIWHLFCMLVMSSSG